MNVFKVLPIDWQAFAAIGTFAAVVVAVLLPVVRERRRLKIVANIGRIVLKPDHKGAYFVAEEYASKIDGEKGTPCLVLSLINLGPLPITIQKWAMRHTAVARRKTGRKYSVLFPENDILPKILSYGEHCMLWHSDVLTSLKDYRRIIIFDSLDKAWKVPHRYLHQINRRYRAVQERE